MQATRSLAPAATLTVGGDGYFEGIESPSTGLNPATGVRTARRPRVPDGATFASGGAFAQLSVAARPWLQLVGNVRYGGVSYEASASDSVLVDGEPAVAG